MSHLDRRGGGSGRLVARPLLALSLSLSLAIPPSDFGLHFEVKVLQTFSGSLFGRNRSTSTQPPPRQTPQPQEECGDGSLFEMCGCRTSTGAGAVAAAPKSCTYIQKPQSYTLHPALKPLHPASQPLNGNISMQVKRVAHLDGRGGGSGRLVVLALVLVG